MRNRTGVTIAPVPKTDAVHEPVIMREHDQNGQRDEQQPRPAPEAHDDAAGKLTEQPFASITFMKIIAMMMTRPTSR